MGEQGPKIPVTIMHGEATLNSKEIKDRLLLEAKTALLGLDIGMRVMRQAVFDSTDHRSKLKSKLEERRQELLIRGQASFDALLQLTQQLGLTILFDPVEARPMELNTSTLFHFEADVQIAELAIAKLKLFLKAPVA